MNISKIDPSLLGVRALTTQRLNCAAFVSDFSVGQDIMSRLNITPFCAFPHIKAFAIQEKLPQLLQLSDEGSVVNVTSVGEVCCLINSAREVTKVTQLHRYNIRGARVGVAVIDTGCFPHLDFLLGHQKKIVFVDLINQKAQMYDDNGHGTFVCGVLAGTGASSGGMYAGIAPEADLVIVKALDSDGKTQGYKILQAMEWILNNKARYNIRVVCMSFGATPASRFDALCIGAEVLWDNGIVVVSAVGNDGPKAGTIKSPAVSSKIISVGSLDTTKPECVLADFSSRGPGLDSAKPDIVAPGVDITSLDNSSKLFTTLSGTSVSAPMVAGIAAILLSEFPSLSPNEVKAKLLSSATRLDYGINECGMGMVDAYECFRAF